MTKSTPTKVEDSGKMNTPFSFQFNISRKAKMRVFGDGVITITTRVPGGGRISSQKLCQFIEFEELDKYYEIEGFISTDDSYYSNKKVLLKFRKVQVNSKLRKYKETYITHPIIHQGYKEMMTIRFKISEKFQSKLLSELCALGDLGYDISILLPLIRKDPRKFNPKDKTQLLQRLRLYIEQQKEIQPLETIKLDQVSTFQIFDHPTISFLLKRNTDSKSSIAIPFPISQMLSLHGKFLPILCDGKLSLVKTHLKKKNIYFDLPIDKRDVREISILTDESGNKVFQRFIKFLQEGGDYRTFFAYQSYMHLLAKDPTVNSDERKLIENCFQDLFSRKVVIPIIDVNCKQSNNHKVESYQDLASKLLAQIQKQNNNQSILLVFPEARVIDSTATTTKIVDWYLVHIQSDKSCKQYALELKTTPSSERTRHLQQAIAEYSHLKYSIPEIGQPFILISWKLNRMKWLKYAQIFGVRLLDINDFYSALTSLDFLSLFQLPPLHGLSKNFHLSPEYLIQRWIKEQCITQDELNNYIFTMGIQTQHICHLLNYCDVIMIDSESYLYRYKYIKLSSPEKLLAIHKSLTKGTRLIVEEELSHCSNRINKLKHEPQTLRKDQPKNTKHFERRRKTKDIPRLLTLEEDLTTLLNHTLQWPKTFRPVCVKMLSDESNQGRDFEKWTAQFLHSKNYVSISNISVQIENYSREIDLVAFSQKPSITHSGLLVSCSDCSRVKSKFSYYKPTIQQKSIELHKFCEVTQFKLGINFIRVARKKHEKQLKTWLLDFPNVMTVIVRDDREKKEEIIQCIPELDFV